MKKLVSYKLFEDDTNDNEFLEDKKLIELFRSNIKNSV